MQELDQSKVNKLKDAEVSVLLVYMEGCQACEYAKGHYDRMAEDYQAITCFKADLNKVLPLYAKYADEDPEVIDEATGKPSKKIVAPMFYVFVKEEQDADNEHGWVGGIPGADLDTLDSVMHSLNQKVLAGDE